MTGAHDVQHGGGAQLTLPAPAKVNLFLHVTGRRADGYHTLESLMACIDLCDNVQLTVRDDGQVTRTRELPGIAEQNDLAVRAARALATATSCSLGVDIAVTKRIPAGGGVGGGSSDAATVLLGLNQLWKLHLPRARLAAIGASLGADVPFFIGGTPAIVRGIGERMLPVTLPTLWLALATPAESVGTAAIFAAPELTRSTPSAKIDVFSEGYGRNDLQPVTTARVDAVARAIAALALAAAGAGQGFARMTGSGACAFAAFASESNARAAVAALPADCGGRVVRTLARHPLAAFAR